MNSTSTPPTLDGARTRLASSVPTGMMPLAGLMVRPFPTPGPMVRTAMHQLDKAASQEDIDEEEQARLADLPRPWDPGTCLGQTRIELWAWLGEVARWINEQHLWSVSRPGIPECWPAHPHLIHELASLACARYYAGFGFAPNLHEDWHRYGLPSFLERLRDRIGDGCQPSRHQVRPRTERDEKHASERVRQGHDQRFRDDVVRAEELASADPYAMTLENLE